MSRDERYEALFQMYAEIPFGAELVKESLLEVLRLQFTPEEAELAVQVGLSGGKLAEIQQRSGLTPDQLEPMLHTMARKGTMWISPQKDDPDYRTISIAGPGLVETGAWGGVRFPHSVALMKALHRFAVEFATQCLPSLGFPTARVWAAPAALPEDAAPSENVAEMIKGSGCFGVSQCSCRLPHWIAEPGNHCEHPLETCLFLGDMARWGIKYGLCREISYDEAVEILHQSNDAGLVHTYDPDEFICNCCTDCCVFHVGMRATGAQLLFPSEFVAVIDGATCTACSDCAERCPTDAISVDEVAEVVGEKCLGCGVCFPSCPTDSVRLERRPQAFHFEMEPA